MSAPGVLEGTTVVVAGGGSGVGREVCQALSDEGARLVVADANPVAAEASVAALGADGSENLAVGVDVADPSSVLEMLAVCADRFGRVDVLVNVVDGVPVGNHETWRDSASSGRARAVGLTGFHVCTAVVASWMRTRGKGCVVNVWLDVDKLFAWESEIPAVDWPALRRVLEDSCRGEGVRVSCIVPSADDLSSSP